MKTIQAWIDQEGISAWLYLAPALILLSIFVFYPTVRLICDSFYNEEDATHPMCFDTHRCHLFNKQSGENLTI